MKVSPQQQPPGTGPSPFANQRRLSGAEAHQVRTMAANLKATNCHPRSPPKDCYSPPHHQPNGCHPKPSHGHCHPSPPQHHDSCHPSGSMKVDKNGTVTTPGGYKIEVCGPSEWKITGPDKKTTRVWGDPHVDEGDGGKWDFKRDSTFVLGDGTRVNVGTKPAGANVTVTDSLEIISGNDRVKIDDVGKGKDHPPAKLTHDGFAHANSFGGKDVFVMGKETDDWSFKGREVIGSNDNGETFKLGDQLPAGGPEAPHRPRVPRDFPLTGAQGAMAGIRAGEPNPAAPNANPYTQQMRQLFEQMSTLFSNLAQSAGNMEGCHFGSNHLSAPGTKGDWLQRRQQHLRRGFDDIGQMMDAFTHMSALSDSVKNHRGNFNA